MNIFLLSLCLFAVLPACPLLATAQNSQAGTAQLDSVLVTGSMRFTSEQIATAIGLRAGEVINRDTLQGAADKLAELEHRTAKMTAGGMPTVDLSADDLKALIAYVESLK